jgi:hypothetical protein
MAKLGHVSRSPGEMVKKVFTMTFCDGEVLVLGLGLC